MSSKNQSPKVIDLFCGIGGLSHGLMKEGFNIVAGIDSNEQCKFGFEYNNEATFIKKDILDVSSNELNDFFGRGCAVPRILVGCAPCQPFSRLSGRKRSKLDEQPISVFARLIEEVKPDIVSMENVAGLLNREKFPVFDYFLEVLNRDYHVHYEVVDVSEYGVPQTRKRLVLLASRFGSIGLIERTHKHRKVTVRKAISHLDPIAAGETSGKDPLHKARQLSELNLKRVKATPKDGGNVRDWSDNLLLNCHKKNSGKSYTYSVYGRMRWDQPAPTMTTHCIGLGNGRFGHPEQHRAISLREAAIFQTFPQDYLFTDPNEPIFAGRIARFIGNAVPVLLGSVIGKSINHHLKAHA